MNEQCVCLQHAVERRWACTPVTFQTKPLRQARHLIQSFSARPEPGMFIVSLLLFVITFTGVARIFHCPRTPGLRLVTPVITFYRSLNDACLKPNSITATSFEPASNQLA